MKKVVSLFIGLMITSGVLAQEVQTLSGKPRSFSGFGGLTISVYPVANTAKPMIGGKGALLINNKLFFGGYGLNMFEERKVEKTDLLYNMEFGHGGLMVGYIIRPEKVINLSFSTRIGWGDLSIIGVDNLEVISFKDESMIITPQVDVQINATQWLKVSTGVGYQLSYGIQNDYYQDRNFTGIGYGVSFLFGWYR